MANVTVVGTAQAPAVSSGTNTPSVSPSWDATQPRTAGDMLCALVTNWGGTTGGTPTTPAGWQLAATILSNARAFVGIYTKIAAGSDTAPGFSATNTGTATFSTLACYLMELTGTDGTTPIVTVAEAQGTTANPFSATAGAVPVAGCYALGAWSLTTSGTSTNTLGAGSGWTDLGDNASTSTRSHFMFTGQASPATGVLSEAVTYTGTGSFLAGAIILFQPAVAALAPYLVGRGSTGGATCLVTVLNKVNVGDEIVCNFSSTSLGVTSVTDAGGNATYTQVQQNTATTNCYQYAVRATTALNPGDTITVNRAGTSGSFNALIVGVPNATASPVDATGSKNASGTSAAPTVTTGTLAQAAEVLVTMINTTNAGGLPAWTSPLAGIGNVQQSPGGSVMISVAGETTAATTAVATAATQVSAAWTVLTACIKVSAPSFTGSGTLSGSGTLGGPGPALASAAGMSGTGTLAAAPGMAGTSAMSGSGTMAGSPALAGSAALSGTGTLAGAPAFRAAGQMSGTGTLAAAPVLVFTGAAVLSGSGTLAGAVAVLVPGAATLSGAGTLAAGPYLAVPGTFSGSGTLSGLWTAGKQSAMSGTGTLAGLAALSGSAGLSGIGTLSGGPAFAGSAGMSGTGTLAAAPVRPATAVLSGSGTLSGSPAFAASVTLSGTGSLSGLWAISVQSALSGSGTLSGAGTVPGGTVSGSAAMSGSGTLGGSLVLTNSAEGGTAGTTVTTGNSGGASGSAFNSISIGALASLAYDNSQAAHGALAYKVATGATVTTALTEWTTSEGTQTSVYYRMYCFIPSLSSLTAAAWRPFAGRATAGHAGSVLFTQAGTIQLSIGTGFTAVQTFVTPAPIGQWFRIEGWITGDAAAGAIMGAIFPTLDARIPVEVKTSVGQNTTGVMSQYFYGQNNSSANSGPFWYDDLGLSQLGFVGPAGDVAGITLTNSAEGQPSGTTVTAPLTGNRYAGAQFDAVNIGAAAALTFDSTQAAHGNLSYKVVTGSPAANAILEWTNALFGPVPQPQAWFRVYVYLTSYSATQNRVVSFRNGATYLGGPALNSTGNVVLLNATGGTVKTSVTALPLNQWVRLEGYLIGDPAAGQLEVQIFTTDPDSPVPDEVVTTSAAQNTGGPINRMDYGDPSSVANYTFWMDELGGSTQGYIGPAGYELALTGVGTLGGSAARPAASALSGSGTLGGALALQGAASMSGTGTLGGVPQVTQPGAGSLSGTGTLGGSGQLAGAAALSGTGTLAAAPRRAGSATLSGNGTLGALSQQGTVAPMSGTGTLSGAGTVPVTGDTGTADWEAAPGQARWQAAPARPRWSAGPAPGRWQSRVLPARWAAGPAPSRWG